MSNDRFFFNPVVNKDEKLQIFEALVKQRASLYLKVENSNGIEVPIEKMSGDRGIVCRIPPDVDASSLFNKDAFISFTYGQQNYFFKSKCFKSAESLGFDVRGTLYVSQARGATRMEIPKFLNATIAIVKHNKDFIEHHGNLIDLSLSGCKAEYIEYPQNLVKDDILEVKILQKDVEEVFLKCQIKSVKMEIINDVQRRADLGLQFIDLSDYKETEVELYFRSLQKIILKKQASDEGE